MSLPRSLRGNRKSLDATSPRPGLCVVNLRRLAAIRRVHGLVASQGQSILALLFHHRRGRLRPPHHQRAPEVEVAEELLGRSPLVRLARLDCGGWNPGPRSPPFSASRSKRGSGAMIAAISEHSAVYRTSARLAGSRREMVVPREELASNRWLRQLPVTCESVSTWTSEQNSALTHDRTAHPRRTALPHPTSAAAVHGG